MSAFSALLLFHSGKFFRPLIPLVPRIIRRGLLKFPLIATVVRVLISGKRAGNGVFWTRIPFDNWSGIRFDLGGMTAGHRRFELRVLALRSLSLDVERVVNVPAESLASASDGYFYWEPIAGSLNSVFMFQIHFPEVLDAAMEPERWWLGEILELFGDPEKTVPPTPRAILFSPVTTCNLNCIHCISRASRRRVQIMPEAIFEQIEKAVLGGYVHHISSDYSGDLLFSDRRHGGWLDRVISLDIAFRVDTHAGGVA